MNDDAENRFGQHIKRARDERGYSLRELGRLCGIDKSNLNKMERNIWPVSPKALFAIARALGVDPDELRAGNWNVPLAFFRYTTNPAPYRAGPVIIDSVCRLYGNDTEQLEISVSYSHETIVLHPDLAEIFDDVLSKVADDARRTG